MPILESKTPKGWGKSGHRNIFPKGDKYEVKVCGTYLGLFKTIKEAETVRDEARKKFFAGLDLQGRELTKEPRN